MTRANLESEAIAHMLAVTIGVGSYLNMARASALRLTKFTGLKTAILTEEHFSHSGLPTPHFLKLHLFDLFKNDAIMYFDADLICLRSWNPRQFIDAEAIVAVVDRRHPVVVEHCKQWGMHCDQYINTGLLILNRKAHSRWLLSTASFVQRSTTMTLWDQTPLNIVRHRLNISLQTIDRCYNWVGFGSSQLSLTMPVYMAHSISPLSKRLSLDYMEGKYNPFLEPQIVLDEYAMRSLMNTQVKVRHGNLISNIYLHKNGICHIAPEVRERLYWFVYKRAGEESRLVLTDETTILREYELQYGDWTLVDCGN